MTDNIIIRRPTEEDIEVIAEFNQIMAKETEGKALNNELLRKGVKGLITNPERGFYLLACIDEKVVGQLLVTYEWSDWRNGTFWWIQSVYVHPEYRRCGIYRKLYNQVKKDALNTDEVCGLRLYVMDSNNIAQTTYSSLGMAETKYLIYEEDFVLD